MLETSSPSDSLLNLLYGEEGDDKSRSPLAIQPPSSPKPVQSSVRPRRASVVRSPYLSSVVARPSPSKRQSPVKATQILLRKNGFVPIKRKTTTSKTTNNDFTEDYAGKTALDLRDELTAMQKSLADMEEQRDTFRGEMIKYKQILVKKDKEIEDLIMGGHVSSRDRARINSGNKADILLAMSSYKHRIHTLERSLRDKDSQILAMQSDVRRTRLKEMELEKETYYAEILRLQGLIEHMQSELDKDVPQSKKQLHNMVEERDRTVNELISKCKALRSERDKLTKLLGFWKENDKIYPSDDSRAEQYLSLSQGAAISALIQMESTINEKTAEVEKLNEDLATLNQKYNEELKALSDKIEEKEKQIKELETFEEKYKHLTEEHTTLKDELNDTRDSLKEEKLNVERTLSLAHSLQEEATTEKLARDYAQKLSKKRAQKRIMEKEELARSATVIQQQWRKYHSKKRQLSFENEQNEIIQSLQSVLRGHAIRQEYLALTKREAETAELVKSFQNILSGHYVRRTLLQQNER